MYMQRGMYPGGARQHLYRRIDGYEDLKPLLEGSDRDVLAALGDDPVLVRIPAASPGSRPRARLISCLLHGNEPSGFQATIELLRRGERFPFDLWVLFGNIRAATEGPLFGHRHLDDQEDLNRVWGVAVPSTEMQQTAAAILAELWSADLEAAIDLHNNTGRNPYYAILTRPTPAGQQLAAQCADTVLLWGQSMHTLMEALAPRCPAVSVECGAAHLADGREYAAAVVHRFLTAERFDGRGPTRETRVVQTAWRVTVEPEADLDLVPGLDVYNFGVLPAGQPIGRVRPGAPMPLRATAMSAGAVPLPHDVTDHLFRLTADGDVVVTTDVMPIMMTTSVQQARRDCLFYTAHSVR